MGTAVVGIVKAVAENIMQSNHKKNWGTYSYFVKNGINYLSPHSSYVINFYAIWNPNYISIFLNFGTSNKLVCLFSLQHDMLAYIGFVKLTH